jgi:hypothetical protein
LASTAQSNRGAIDRALDMFMESVKGIGELHERLRGRKVSVNRAKSLTVDLASAGAIPSAHILPVVREFEKPSFKDFRGDRSAWGLYGAVTHASFKRMSPQRAADGYRALNEVLVGSDPGSN